jgi:toxin ParE1/3/4
MAPKPIRFHPAAADEAAAHTWYAKGSATVARAFREDIVHAVDAIAADADRWPRFGPGTRTRCYPLARFPFIVIYRNRYGSVDVLAVAHDNLRPHWRLRIARMP